MCHCSVACINRTIMTASRFFVPKLKSYYLHIDTCEFVGKEGFWVHKYDIDAYDVQELLEITAREIDETRRFMINQLIRSIKEHAIRDEALNHAINRICAMQSAQSVLHESVKILGYCKNKMIVDKKEG